MCAVATQGNGATTNEWVKKYKVLFSTNNLQWTTYSTNSGEKEFNGNTDKTTVVTNAITKPFRARFVRVLPTTYQGWKLLRVDLKGLPLGCTSSLGLENSQIPDSQITSSSFWNASNGDEHLAIKGRLYGSLSWCSGTNVNTEYIQVDLGQVKTVTGIATQGNPSFDAWVTSYKVEYSFDDIHWNEYREGQVVKILDGNTNRNDVKVNWLRQPIAARYVRIYPQTHSSGGGQCLRFDLYGCDIFLAPKVVLDTADFTLPSIKGSSRTLTCSVLGEPAPDIQWFNNGIKINGATQSTLQIQFISAEDVVSKYNCTRQDPNTRAVVCNTFYTCRIVNPVYLPSGGINETTPAKVTVFLNVSKPPGLALATPNKRSITLRWEAMTASDDTGTITSYTIRLNYHSGSIGTYFAHDSAVNYTFKHLNPYTNYSIKMNAVSAVGQGLWSSWLNVRTLIAEPQGTPTITGSTALSSRSIGLYLQYSRLDLLHGPMAGYRIFYTPKDGSEQQTDVGIVDNVTLTNLRKYTHYRISVAVRNTLYVGPTSDSTGIRTLEDVPDIGPQNTTSTKLNDTTFLVTWQPLTTAQSNGVVTKYEIIWSLSVMEHHSRRSLPEVVNVTTQATQYTLYNLRLCANYEVSVRGYTSVGPGPKSTINILTTQPGKPTGVQAEHQTKTSIELRWQKPLPTSLVVGKYMIEVKGSKSYWSQYSFSRTYTQNGARTKMVIDNLVPGTSYVFRVYASTECGTSEKSAPSKGDTDIDIPVKPKGSSLNLKDEFQIRLWPVEPTNGPISSYQVIVIKEKKDVINLPANISDYKAGKELYVTAELKPKEFKSSFPVGDNEKYGNYKNVPLNKGKTYTIAERAITEHQGKSYVGQAAVVATIKITQDHSNSTIWALAGEEITIGCYANGQEPIKYLWRKEGILLVADSPTIKIRGNNLIITFNSDKEFGTYVCTATNNDTTIVYRISRVELKKYIKEKQNTSEKRESKAKQVVPYVTPLALIILGLVICIVYLVFRLRKERKHNEKYMKSKKDQTDIANDGMDNSSFENDVTVNPKRPKTAKAEEIENPGYMELQPRQSKDLIYQPIQKLGKSEAPHKPFMTEHEQYMELYPQRVNTEYETLHHKKNLPGQDYEDVSQSARRKKNQAFDDTEA